MTSCRQQLNAVCLASIMFGELVGREPRSLFSSCILGKTSAHIPGPHLWAGVCPRNGKARSRELEAMGSEQRTGDAGLCLGEGDEESPGKVIDSMEAEGHVPFFSFK